MGLPYCLMKQFYSIHINFYWQQRGIILCSVHPSTQPPHTHPLRCHSCILCFLEVCAKTPSLPGPFPGNNRTSRIQAVLEFWRQTGWVQKLAWMFHIGQITGLLGAFKSWSKGKGYMQISNLQLLWISQEVICMQWWPPSLMHTGQILSPAC